MEMMDDSVEAHVPSPSQLSESDAQEQPEAQGVPTPFRRATKIMRTPAGPAAPVVDEAEQMEEEEEVVCEPSALTREGYTASECCKPM